MWLDGQATRWAYWASFGAYLIITRAWVSEWQAVSSVVCFLCRSLPLPCLSTGHSFMGESEHSLWQSSSWTCCPPSFGSLSFSRPKSIKFHKTKTKLNVSLIFDSFFFVVNISFFLNVWQWWHLRHTQSRERHIGTLSFHWTERSEPTSLAQVQQSTPNTMPKTKKKLYFGQKSNRILKTTLYYTIYCTISDSSAALRASSFCPSTLRFILRRVIKESERDESSNI